MTCEFCGKDEMPGKTYCINCLESAMNMGLEIMYKKKKRRKHGQNRKTVLLPNNR